MTEADPVTDAPQPESGGGAGLQGLSSDEAARLLAQVGPNAVTPPRDHPVRRFVAAVTGPVPFLLEAAVVVELLGRRDLEAAIIGVLLVFNAVLSLLEEQRAQNALELLRARLAIRARVRRDGAWTTVDAAALVPGDVVHIRVGDVVPADLTVLEGQVAIDASVLTGESRSLQLDGGGTCFAGATVVRGEATGVVAATGARTYFGHTAQLVRDAKTQSHLERTILSVVRALLALDAVVVVAVVADGLIEHLSASTLLPFLIILLVAAVPVALPATFTLATSVGALELARGGVLVTHLTAIEEAAAMDLLCSDKTGTITRNELRVVGLEGYASTSGEEVLRAAALASDAATQDPIDLAILESARERGIDLAVTRVAFTPFDPSTKRSSATIEVGTARREYLKGAPDVVAQLVGLDPAVVHDSVAHLAAGGARVLAVGTVGDVPALLGFVALGDPLRPDSRDLIATLHDLGVRVIMVSGDAPETALAVAQAVGIGARLGSLGTIRQRSAGPVDFDVLAGVLPEDKLLLVERAQRQGHVVGMTGDGVNDAPALKRAEVGIAVATATDVAKSSASVVLTTDGLGGIVRAVETGRRVYQRMLTYTINKIVKTFQVSLFLGLGLLITDTFVTTPRLVLLLLFANDFVTMALATDRVGFSRRPNRWRVRDVALVSLVIASAWLAVSFGTFYAARDLIHLHLAGTQTLVFVMLVVTGQATVYLVREPGHLWRARPSAWLMAATVADVLVVGALATSGVLMARVPWFDVLGELLGVLVVTLILDMVKAPLLRRVRDDAA